MSQFYIQSSSGGVLPPNVPTTFTTDFQSNGTPGGTVTPVNNNVHIEGDIASNGTQGIVTYAKQVNVPNDTVYIQYVDGTQTTIGATTETIFDGVITDDSSITIQAIVNAFCMTPGPTFGETFGGRLLVVARNVGGVASIQAELENLSVGTGTLAFCAFSASAATNRILMTVTGVVGETVKWHIILPNIASAPQ